MSNPAVPTETGRPTKDAALLRGPGIAIAVALALATAGLEAAIAAQEPTNQARTIVLTLAIWFQGAWALLLWRRPERDLVAIGLAANLGFIAATAIAAALAPDPSGLSAAQVVAMTGQLALVATCAFLFSGRGILANPRAMLPLALTTGLIAIALAATSLAVAAPPTLPGTSDPIAGRAAAGGRAAGGTTVGPASPVARSTTEPTSPAQPPSPQPTGREPSAAPTGFAVAVAGLSPSDGPADTPGASNSSAPTETPWETPTEALPATAGLTASPGAKARPTASHSATPRPTPSRTTTPAAVPPPTATSAPAATQPPTAAATPRPTPVPTPRPTPRATPEPTPRSTPTPTTTPTQEATVAPGAPGTIGFGRDYDPETLAVVGPTRTLHVGQQVAWRADLAEAAGTSTLTFTVTEPLPSGKEFPHWQQDFSVPDPSFTVLVKRVDMSVYVHDEPGNYIMRIRRGADGEILAEGTFTVLP